MPIIVQKYGGSSVANTEKLKQVAAKVVAAREAGNELVVVVSAMGNRTDELVALAREISRSPNRRELDMLVSVGERVSMALLSMAIHDLGQECISFTGSQAGIITNDAQGAARIIDIRPYRVQDELDRGRIVIIAGYQGVSYKKEVTTLGRGGSDTTAVALAAALGADRCEIYSDVEGVFSSDPKVVLDARKLETISYEEMQELARFGAKVVNAEAVAFAQRAGICLYARATDSQNRGTRIGRPDGFPDTHLAEERAAYVTGVAGRKDVFLVEYSTPPSGDDRSRDLLARLAGADLLFSSTQSGRHAALAIVSTENIADPEGLAAELRHDYDETIGVRTQLGMVTAVGSSVGNRTAAQERLLSALEAAGIVSQLTFTSRSAVSAVVDAPDVDRAVQVVHAEFLGEP
jgi:aspartate kinase